MKYVWHDGQWYPVAPRSPRPSVFPSIIRDTMEPLQHMATGEVFDSKSAFRQATKDAGCEELGNDVPTAPVLEYDHRELQADIATAYEQVEQGAHVPELDSAGPDVRMVG